MCPKFEPEENPERPVCPSPPSDYEENDAEIENNVGIYTKTELLRLLLVTQKFVNSEKIISGKIL